MSFVAIAQLILANPTSQFSKSRKSNKPVLKWSQPVHMSAQTPQPGAAIVKLTRHIVVRHHYMDDYPLIPNPKIGPWTTPIP